MEPTDPPDERSDDIWKELITLHTELRIMVEAGLLVELSVPRAPSRYALTELGEQLTGLVSAYDGQQASADEPHHEFPLDWPEPCPVCRATDGFDGGGRCLRWYVPWPPEM
jgi:hypothetical protein